MKHGHRCFDMYFQEHADFKTEAYIGPTYLIAGEHRA